MHSDEHTIESMKPSPLKHFSILVQALLALSLFFANTATAADLPDAELKSLSVKYAGVKIEGDKPIEWSYAYFAGPKSERVDSLNAWIRTQSIERLFHDEELVARALQNKDSAVIEWLRSDEKIKAAASDRAAVVPVRAFGNLIIFFADSSYAEERYYLLSEVFIYDFDSGKTVPIEKLFKPGAESELNNLLAKSIRKLLRSAKDDYNKCLKKKTGNKTSCVGEEIDIEQCVENTHINWGNLNIIDSRHLSLDFPYRPWIHLACGTEFGFEINSPEVEDLFFTPALFKKARRLHKVE